eukprot:c43210_g1_i1 orf=145-924(+)
MAMAVPQVRVQQLHPKLSFPGKGSGSPSSLQHLRAPNKAFNNSSLLLRKLHRPRQHILVPHANADTVPLQEDQAQPSVSSQQDDEANCREILRVLEILKEKRDMSFNEVRLTILIEDPSEEERREQFNVENERGCSREDMAAALVDVYEGRIPSDRTALLELTREMVTWPNLEDESEIPSDPTQSPYARSTDTGIDPKIVAQKIKKVDFDSAAEIQPGEESEDANVPPVVGFSLLYLVSVIPILIGIGVVAILYFNSFR